MKIVEFNSNNKNEVHKQIVLIFGIGLIGTSILNKIQSLFLSNVTTLNFSWDNEYQQNIDLNNIIKIIFQQEKGINIDVIWCAGKAGFFSTQESINDEIQSYKSVLKFVNDLSIQMKGSIITFHLFSSAGGLFEGQNSVSDASLPKPLRPYGYLKQLQENLLLENSVDFNFIIYRPSSVYGYIPNTRIGLISNILYKSIRNEFVEIFASKSSLRDYVYVEDISSFVIGKIVNLKEINRHNNIYYLVSGKPTSIEEIMMILENILNKKIYYSYNLIQTNTLDNSFNMKLVPYNFINTPLSLGLEKTYNDLLSFNF